jgi:phage-related protein
MNPLRRGKQWDDRNLAARGADSHLTLDRTYKYMYTGISIGSERKPVRWMGNSLRDLRSFPRPVRVDIGHALFAAQEGKTDPAAKPLKRFGGASVLEIVVSHIGNAWRAVYTVRFQDAIYVLHVFQKKSTKGIATPARTMELVKQRLADAERDHRERRK